MNELTPTSLSKKMFPTTGFQWFVQMPRTEEMNIDITEDL